MLTPRAALLAALATAAIIATGCQSTGSAKATGSSQAASSATAGGATAASSRPPAHSEDVTIAACANDDAGYAAAKVVVTNHSSKTSNYAITIAFESPDGKTQIGTGLVAVDNLAAGQSSSPQDAISMQTPSGIYTCKLADLTRFAS